MKKSNGGGKLFGIINIIDLLFILVVAGVAAVAFVYLSTGGFNDGEEVTVKYTVEFQAMEKGFHKYIEVGDAVKDSIKGYYLGKVESVETKPSQLWVLNEETKQYSHKTIEDEEVILLTIESTGRETDSVIVSENNEVRVGKEMYVEGKGFVKNGYIVKLWTETTEDK